MKIPFSFLLRSTTSSSTLYLTRSMTKLSGTTTLTPPPPPPPSSTYPYRMPAEWEQHLACILLYPHNPATYRLGPVREQFHLLVQAILEQGQETAWVLFPSIEIKERYEPSLHRALTTTTAIMEGTVTNDNHHNGGKTSPPWSFPRLITGICPSNDTWARDTAPTFLLATTSGPVTTTTTTATTTTTTTSNPSTITTTLVGVDWDFNAYGYTNEKLEDGDHNPDGGWPYDKDQRIAATICQEATVALGTVPVLHRKVSPSFVLEGGSIHTDGEGTILTTKECLLHPNRNPHLTMDQITDRVLRETGCTKLIWLPRGLAHDEDTNGHVDNFCARGRSIEIHKLHVPHPPLTYSTDEIDTLQQDREGQQQQQQQPWMERRDGQILAASYVNFYIANQAVIVPQFGCAEWDVRAIETLRPLFPGRRVVGVPSREILLGGGNIHCVTQQVPLP